MNTNLKGQVVVIAGGMEGRTLWRPAEIDPSIAQLMNFVGRSLAMTVVYG